MKVKKRPPLFEAYKWRNALHHHPTWILAALKKCDNCLGAIRFRGDAFYINSQAGWVGITEGDYIVFTEANICEVFESYAFEREFEVVSES